MTGSFLQSVRMLRDGFLQLVYPNVCWVCEQLRAELAQGICPGCAEALVHDPHPACRRCAGSVGPFVNLEDGCPHCRGENFAFDQTVRVGPYLGVLRATILRMKSRAGADLTEVIGALWARHAQMRLRDLRPHVVAPVPLHWTRRWRRGFNQSELLASALAGAVGAPCRNGMLRRTRPTPPQTQQTPAERRTNVRNAFRTPAGLALTGQTVLLVDDVLTTGATAHEAARALRQAGAGKVIVAVLAAHRE